ncbi:MAG TPA: hypothetical protein VGI32_08250 [Steroidobacteraceae bacterium]|jgi:hypothetical protein
MTPLHSTLKRALTIDGRDYVLTLNETALKLTLKGKRNGVELPWSQLVNGEAALAVALHASLGAFAKKAPAPTAEAPAAAKPSPAAKPAGAKPATSAKAKRKAAPARKK